MNRKNVFNLLVVFMATILINACSFLGHNENFKKSEHYTFTFQHPDWQKIESLQADHVFKHKMKSEYLFLNTHCRSMNSTYIEDLNLQLLGGLENISIKTRQAVDFFHRKAVETTATGYFEGIQNFLKIRTWKENDCIYDFVLITAKEDTLNDKKLWQAFLEDFTPFAYPQLTPEQKK